MHKIRESDSDAKENKEPNNKNPSISGQKLFHKNIIKKTMAYLLPQ